MPTETARILRLLDQTSAAAQGELNRIAMQMKLATPATDAQTVRNRLRRAVAQEQGMAGAILSAGPL